MQLACCSADKIKEAKTHKVRRNQKRKRDGVVKGQVPPVGVHVSVYEATHKCYLRWGHRYESCLVGLHCGAEDAIREGGQSLHIRVTELQRKGAADVHCRVFCSLLCDLVGKKKLKLKNELKAELRRRGGKQRFKINKGECRDFGFSLSSPLFFGKVLSAPRGHECLI